MAIDVRCPECGRASKAPDGSAGKRARCQCGAEFRVPSEDPLVASLRAVFATPDAAVVAVQASVVPRPGGAGNPMAELGISLRVEPMREGRLLVLSPEAVLPDRCVKCNTPAGGLRQEVRRTWRDTGTTLLVLVLLLFLPVVWSRSYRADIKVGVCRRHANLRRLKSAPGGCVVLASVGMIVGGSVGGAEYGYDLVAGIALFPFSVLCQQMAARLLVAHRIEPRLIWIKGVCPEYLAELPRRTG